MSDIAPTTGDQHLEPFGDDFHSGRLVMMTTYVQDGVLEAAPSAAPLVMQDFGSLGIKEYLGPAPNQSDGRSEGHV